MTNNFKNKENNREILIKKMRNLTDSKEQAYIKTLRKIQN